MNPLDFLAAVLPSAEDFYCIAELSSNAKQHVFGKQLDKLADTAAKLDAAELDTYFALAAFKNSGDRTAANAVSMRSFFLDIDCAEDGPKTYATKQDGMDAFEAFLVDTNLGSLGRPLIVDSGGGYHVYWPLLKNVDITTWKPIAENFKRLCKQHGLKIDFTVPADAARVLRVPNTTNWKRVRKYGVSLPVSVVEEANPEAFDIDAFAWLVRSQLKEIAPIAPPPMALPGSKPKAAVTATAVKLFENSSTYFKNILVKTQAGTGCKQLEYYLQNAQEDGMEPLWRGLLSLAVKCEDGTKAANFLTQQHPYTPERMAQKLREIKGPYPCVKLDSENPGVCTGCRHFGKITNPLILGREVQVDTKEKVIEAVVPATATEEESTVVYVRPSPPRGFSYGKKGGIYRDVDSTDDDGKPFVEHRMILAYDMFIMDILKPVGGEHTVHMVALRPEGAVDILFPQKSIISKDELAKALASHNIVAAFGAGNDQFLTAYARSCVEVYSAERGAIGVPSSYGWQKDGTFAHNNNIYSASGPTRRVPMPGLENVFRGTGKDGTLDGWKKRFMLLATSAFNAPEVLHPLLAAACTGFGSILMEFSGINGLTMHLGHKQSGTGKSYALRMQASIWGHPDLYRTSSQTSDVAMLQRAGLLNSLPLTSDEITTKSRKDMEWFPGFAFAYSEGGGKDRMEGGANKERINTSQWSGMCLLSSNVVMMDYMTGSRKHSSEGELRRMLEYSPKVKLKWTEEELTLIKTYKDHYGIAGPIFVQWVMRNRDTVKRIFAEVNAKLKKDFKMVDDERFWLAGCTATVTGAILVGSNYANIIDLPIEGIIAGLRKMVVDQRAQMRSSVRTAEDVLSDYTTAFYGNLIVMSAANPLGIRFGDDSLVEKNTLRTNVAGRVEHDVVPGFTDFYIEETQLKGHCAAMGFGYADFKKDMETLFRVQYLRRFDLLRKTNGPPMRVNCIKISQPTVRADEPNDEEDFDV